MLHSTYRFKKIIFFCLLAGGIGALSSCHKRVGPTTLRIVDPIRHYYPLVQGEDLKMNYLIINTGHYPFIIQDIQPASLSVELTKEHPHLIPSGDSLNVSLVFHTDRNIGYAQHKIRIFGNVSMVNDTLEVMGEAVLTFDTHIVHPTLDQSDYEERYWEKKANSEKRVNGTRGEQGYYTDEDIRENELNDNYEFYPNDHRDQQVERTVNHLKFKSVFN